MTALDRKLASASLDSYTGLVTALFDHSIPLKREQEFFLERMEEVFGRDPVTEIPRVTQAARTVNMELPIAREKGTLSCQQTNAQSQWGGDSRGTRSKGSQRAGAGAQGCRVCEPLSVG